jgi:hypothetical protein
MQRLKLAVMAALMGVSIPALAQDKPAMQDKPMMDDKPVTVVGTDSYFGQLRTGGSNYETIRDGYWAGAQVFTPSVNYINYRSGKTEARYAAGIGSIPNLAGFTVGPTVEAWVRQPVGTSGATVTAGRFWVPFGRMHWQFENKDGLQLDTPIGSSESKLSLSAAATQNRYVKKSNFYAHLSKQFSATATAGVSVARGDGLSFNSTHNQAWGADALVTVSGIDVETEYMSLKSKSGDMTYFDIFFSKQLGAWKPSLSYYSLKDKSEYFSKLNSLVPGVAYRLTPNVSIEAANAFVNGKQVTWTQLHFTFATK